LRAFPQEKLTTKQQRHVAMSFDAEKEAMSFLWIFAAVAFKRMFSYPAGFKIAYHHRDESRGNRVQVNASASCGPNMPTLGLEGITSQW